MGVTLWPVSSSTKQLGLRIRSPFRYQNLTLSDYLAVVLPGDMDAAKRLQEANLHHSQQAECYDFGKEKIIAVSWTLDCNSRDHDIIGASVWQTVIWHRPGHFHSKTYDPLLRHFTTMPSFSWIWLTMGPDYLTVQSWFLFSIFLQHGVRASRHRSGRMTALGQSSLTWHVLWQTETNSFPDDLGLIRNHC